MKPIFHPQLVNGPFEDPLLFVDFAFERRALLFDLGELGALATRKLLRITDVFVSHTHMDHFVGFDRLLRVCVGRDRRIRMFGPPGFIDRVEHKLAAYTWNLVQSYEDDLLFVVTEVHEGERGRRARFSCRAGFRRQAEEPVSLDGGVLIDEPGFRVRAALLDHRTPCVGYALDEKVHVNVWKSRLDSLGLVTGPWLRRLKELALAQAPDETPIVAAAEDGERGLTLGELRRDVLRFVPGQKIGYVVDVAYTEANRRRIVDLVRGADRLYIESVFLDEDADRAAERCHLTAAQAGSLAREAGVAAIEPIHFSPRYSDREDALRAEAECAFAGVG